MEVAPRSFFDFINDVNERRTRSGSPPQCYSQPAPPTLSQTTTTKRARTRTEEDSPIATAASTTA